MNVLEITNYYGMKNKLIAFFENTIVENILTIVLLLLLFLSEWFAFRIMRCPVELAAGKIGWPFIVTVSAFSIIFSLKLCFQGVSLSIMNRFLNNALGLKFLSFIFILAFLVHISWLSDSCLEFFVTGDWHWGNIIITIIGITCLVLSFPVKQKKKTESNADEKTLLVTGISSISEHFMDLFFKPLEKYTNIEKVIVLLSNQVLEDVSKINTGNFEAYGECGQRYIESVEEYKRKLEAYKTTFEVYKTTHDDKLLNKVSNELRTQGHIVCGYLGEFLNSRLQSKYIGYDNKSVKFIFSEPVNYNDFDACYLALKYELVKEEQLTRNTIINISPGTAMVSGAMTIFAIKGDRTLIYVRQDEKKELAVFNIDVLTVKDLIMEFYSEIESKEN